MTSQVNILARGGAEAQPARSGARCGGLGL